MRILGWELCSLEPQKTTLFWLAPCLVHRTFSSAFSSIHHSLLCISYPKQSQGVLFYCIIRLLRANLVSGKLLILYSV